MRFFRRKPHLHLEPAVGRCSRHHAAFPQAVEGFVGLHTLDAKGAVCQRSHREAGATVGAHVGIAGGVFGADIHLLARLAVLLAVNGRGRSQECLGVAVGTFDVDSFYGISSS